MVTIYVIRVKGSDWVYVGSTVNLKRRIVQHRTMLRQGKHTSAALQRVVAKTGVNATAFEVLETCSHADAKWRECVWINKMAKTLNVSNIKAASARRSRKAVKVAKDRYILTDEDRKKQSERRKGHKGRTLTSEQSAHMNSFPKPPISDERRAQISRLGKSWGTPVINLTTGKIYPSQMAASRAYRFSPSTIYQVLCGQCRTAGGCEWDYHTTPSLSRGRSPKKKPPAIARKKKVWEQFVPLAGYETPH